MEEEQIPALENYFFSVPQKKLKAPAALRKLPRSTQRVPRPIDTSKNRVPRQHENSHSIYIPGMLVRASEFELSWLERFL